MAMRQSLAVANLRQEQRGALNVVCRWGRAGRCLVILGLVGRSLTTALPASVPSYVHRQEKYLVSVQSGVKSGTLRSISSFLWNVLNDTTSNWRLTISGTAHLCLYQNTKGENGNDVILCAGSTRSYDLNV